MSPFLGPQPWEAPDPLPVMRRELKLLLIEMNLLRIEVEQSRSIREEAQAREAFFSASVKQLTEGRDKWRRECGTPPRPDRTRSAMVAVLAAAS
jgi:hypothetical protein